MLVDETWWVAYFIHICVCVTWVELIRTPSVNIHVYNGNATEPFKVVQSNMYFWRTWSSNDTTGFSECRFTSATTTNEFYRLPDLVWINFFFSVWMGFAVFYLIKSKTYKPKVFFSHVCVDFMFVLVVLEAGKTDANRILLYSGQSQKYSSTVEWTFNTYVWDIYYNLYVCASVSLALGFVYFFVHHEQEKIEEEKKPSTNEEGSLKVPLLRSEV